MISLLEGSSALTGETGHMVDYGAMKTVLVIEDHVSVLESITTILEGEGWHVVGAADGREGLAQAERCSPDLVLSDYYLPQLNGLEILQNLRKIPHFETTPFVLMSMDGRHCLKERSLQSGASAFLQKSFDNRELIHLVKQFLA